MKAFDASPYSWNQMYFLSQWAEWKDLAALSALLLILAVEHNQLLSHAWWLIAVIQTFRMLRLEDSYEFKARLDYIVCLVLDDRMRLCLKRSKTQSSACCLVQDNF